MGRGRFKGRGGRGGNRGAPRRDNRAYPPVHKENERLQKYYDLLLSLPQEENKDFWDAYKRDLPNSFRFCGSKGHALTVKKLLETRYIPEITTITHFDGQPIEPPLPVPWYPEGLAWWMTTPKNIVRRFPPFASFQKFLVSETTVGNISRQEVVSMIPPLLMDLKPGMVVLDMCAAPGSKAAQLLEMIHMGEEGRVRKALQLHSKEDGREVSAGPDDQDVDMDADPSDDGRATGVLIANDSDYKRSHMLIHQLKRLSSPNMIVTNHDATMFPPLRIGVDEHNKPKYLKFDRILADVPCSGDGTLRKNVNLWKDWLPGNALGLHLTQVRILVRALQMLKPGGRVVYSTCSMNPVENEAVVAAAIDRCGGLEKVEIVDCSKELPGLKRVPGLKKWPVMDKQNRIWNDWNEVEEWTKQSKDGVTPGRLVESMFSRVEGSDTEDLPLERCMRVYPHLQDTGGFFITALHKKAEFKAKPEKPANNPTTNKPANGDAQAAEPITKPEENGNENGTTEEPKNPLKRMMEDPLQQENGSSELIKNPLKRGLEEDAGEEVPVKRQNTGDEKPDAKVELQDGYGVKKKNSEPFEEPFKYLPQGHEVIETIKTFYSISPRFPTDRYMVRNAIGEPAKAIYYTGALVRDILVNNEGKGVKFIHGGVKMYMKQDAPSAEVCRWRIQSEGLPILQGYVGDNRVVRLRNKETLRRLLIEMFPKISGDEWQKLDEIGERVREIGMGCCVLKVEPDGSDEDFTEHMALPLWKSFHSLNLMLPKEDRAAMLLRIYNDTTPLVNNVQPKNKPQPQTEQSEGKSTAEEADAKMVEGDAAPKEELDTELAAVKDEELEAELAAEDAPSP
ncbi:putative trna (cytosine-5-)-methyltransferase ncl1 protein [Phaeoacremonium minimum UCRPA7]|uniref:Putative trna (Cytosine-5-)-methyltransferase ncl1 protein n=1 Tax=Phaeoacremonium minimum (strain UCR-PA7) TaxID=1286976 RepID=R8BB88_PHAM7|nr:putative trna (cytosine-5-)-methyltransferase ncl1 protein [Phaeoacremonium minimum UCRPA7]EON96598.1 putative trna (cytosine-5-)-methyltransferase ncl1 protein [Phaeoacremonium minimum UCRPA7]